MKDGDKSFLFWLAVAVGGIALFGGAGYVTYTHYKQRGIRNNNPGNMVLTDIAWKGKVPRSRNTDGKFEQFEDYQGIPGHIWGIRANYIDIKGDILTRGYSTIKKLITSYAPPSENNTAAYIAVVAKAVGKSADAVLTAADVRPVMLAVFQHENAAMPYKAKDIDWAISLA